MTPESNHSRSNRTRPSIHWILPGILSSILGGLVLTGCANSPTAGTAGAHSTLDPTALALLKASSTKLGAAKTLEVNAEHRLDPPLGLGLVIDNGPIEFAVKRPNQFYAIHPAGRETREISYDGHQLCVMHPGAMNHALESIEATNIEEFAVRVDERFGFRPPLAELLASDMAAELLIDVTSARLLKKERIGGVECEHLRLDQAGMTTDLWLSVEDKLPRRLLTTITDIPKNPKWDIQLFDWKLDQAVDESLFSKRPPVDSVKVQLTKSR